MGVLTKMEHFRAKLNPTLHTWDGSVGSDIYIFNCLGLIIIHYTQKLSLFVEAYESLESIFGWDLVSAHLSILSLECSPL